MKKLLSLLPSVLLTCLVFGISTAIADGGETPFTATVIPSLPYCDEGTTTGFADDHTISCVTADGPDAWYVLYVLEEDIILNASTCGSAYNTAIEVWWRVAGDEDTTLCCCNDDWPLCAPSSCCTEYVPGGSIIFICVDGWSGASGDYFLHVRNAPGGGAGCPGGPCIPHADDCVDVIEPETVPSSHSGDLAGSDPDPGSPGCGIPMSGPGVWYSVIGTGNTMSASTCNPATMFDTQIHVYCGECANLVCVGANDNVTMCPYSPILSRVIWCSMLGQAYYVLASGPTGQSGSLQVDLVDNGMPCPTPAQCPCIPAREATLRTSSTGGLTLRWIAPVPGLYHVFSTTDPNNDGDPDGGMDPDWLLRASLPLTAGLHSWQETDPSPLYRNYVLTHRCQF